MDFKVNFDINAKIYLRNPESSELGKQIVKKSIELIYELGFEQFTFKKLSIEIESTEASIYRYFENKHRLLLYILNWYWSYMEFLIHYRLQNVSNPREKLRTIIELLTNDLQDNGTDYNIKHLNHIVISESSKAYLVKEVSEINKQSAFKPYKDLCAMIAAVITAYNPKYKYPRSLSTTLIETSHYLQYFSKNLPRLTDVESQTDKKYVFKYLENLLFKTLS